MLLKDNNPSTQYASWLLAAMRLMDMLENIDTYEKESQELIQSLLVDCNKRRKLLKDRSDRLKSIEQKEEKQTATRPNKLTRQKTAPTLKVDKAVSVTLRQIAGIYEQSESLPSLPSSPSLNPEVTDEETPATQEQMKQNQQALEALKMAKFLDQRRRRQGKIRATV